MNGNRCSLASFKQAAQYFLEKSFFEVSSQSFSQVIGIAIGSNPAPFFTNLLFHYESEWIRKIMQKSILKFEETLLLPLLFV